MRTSGKCLSTLLDQRWMGGSRVTPYMTIRHKWRELELKCIPHLFLGLFLEILWSAIGQFLWSRLKKQTQKSLRKFNSAQFPSRFSMPYATCTSPIMHLICQPKFFITRSPWAPGITFVFHFPWISQPSQEKLKTMLLQNLRGKIRRIMGYVQVPYLQLAEIQFKKCTSFYYVRLLVQSSFIYLLIRKDVWS